MTKVFDNKFGNIVVDNKHSSSIARLTAQENGICSECKYTIDGVGKDADVVTNANGGKQSKSPMAMHLLDPDFLYNTIDKITSTSTNNRIDTATRAIKDIALYMGTGDTHLLYRSINCLAGLIPSIIEIAKVLQYGAEKYEPNNWRLIPREEHINHALIHLIADISGDTQDDHIPHAMCRIMMAIATKESSGFCYNKYVDTKF